MAIPHVVVVKEAQNVFLFLEEGREGRSRASSDEGQQHKLILQDNRQSHQE